MQQILIVKLSGQNGLGAPSLFRFTHLFTQLLKNIWFMYLEKFLILCLTFAML